jgi:hypothetical protein
MIVLNALVGQASTRQCVKGATNSLVRVYQVERFNAGFKRMLHHVILDNPSSWHKYVSFTTWAILECSNATTVVSPYTLLFGRFPRGPLTVLHDSW